MGDPVGRKEESHQRGGRTELRNTRGNFFGPADSEYQRGKTASWKMQVYPQSKGGFRKWEQQDDCASLIGPACCAKKATLKEGKKKPAIRPRRSAGKLSRVPNESTLFNSSRKGANTHGKGSDWGFTLTGTGRGTLTTKRRKFACTAWGGRDNLTFTRFQSVSVTGRDQTGRSPI